MLNRLIPLVLKLRQYSPGLYAFVTRIAKRFMGDRLGIYPRLMGGEIGAVTAVLRGSQWNMAYGGGLAHEGLEAAFAEYVGVPYAIAVGSGGMAIQMSLRALGLLPGDEAVHQVDTCSATAMAVMNAGPTPIFADISKETFMLDPASVEAVASPATKALIPTHMWGNPENMAAMKAIADARGWKLIEDACLGLGARAGGRQAGAWGDAGVFSFGCIKPIQGGEGGMIVTSDEALARELRTMRHWGNRTIEFGSRDVTELSWNGRMPEIVAAVVREQLRGYPAHLKQMREAVADFRETLKGLPGLNLVLGNTANLEDSALTQVVLRIDEAALGMTKDRLWQGLSDAGIPLWHANFELINSLSYYSGTKWRDWVLRGDLDRVAKNYTHNFPVARAVYQHGGIGLTKMNFLSKGNLDHLKKTLATLAAKKGGA